MLLIDARCTILPGQEGNFIREVRKIIPVVRREAGCTRYDLLSDIDTPGIFHFIEVWENQTHLTDHLAQPHMQEYFANTARWQSSPTKITHYEILSSRSITMDD
jgi:quinol monooxygenase YgiN